MSDAEFPHHRANVGVVLFNQDGRVWLGRRTGAPEPWNWQFPQGGIDEDEDMLQAALRELEEETGVVSVRHLGRTEGWITYDFPADMPPTGTRGWKGQKQAWFAFEFTGNESEIRLDLHQPPEFDAWRWADLSEAPQLVIPFKRHVYDAVVRVFVAYASK